MILDQKNFDYLLSLEKKFEDLGERLLLGPPPIKWSRNLVSINEGGEAFILDFYRGRIELQKYVFNKRYRKCIILVRLCSQGKHTNPDGKSFDGPHVHVYSEGYDDKIAYPISKIGITDIARKDLAMIEFFSYCNIKDYPSIQLSIV